MWLSMGWFRIPSIMHFHIWLQETDLSWTHPCTNKHFILCELCQLIQFPWKHFSYWVSIVILGMSIFVYSEDVSHAWYGHRFTWGPQNFASIYFNTYHTCFQLHRLSISNEKYGFQRFQMLTNRDFFVRGREHALYMPCYMHFFAYDGLLSKYYYFKFICFHLLVYFLLLCLFLSLLIFVSVLSARTKLSSNKCFDWQVL